MGSRKSLVDPTMCQVELLSRLVQDVTSFLGVSQKECDRDIITISERVAKEGSGFLTKTLPRLGKVFDRALETGWLIPPPGFRTRRGTNIPVFLRGMFSILFATDGRLLSGDSFLQKEAVRGLRQIFYLFYKQEEGYSRKLESQVIDSFLTTEAEISTLSFSASDDEILFKASLLLEELFKDFDPRDITPRHGPGAVATGEKGNRKYTFSRKYASLHSYYRYYDYFTVGVGPEVRDRALWYTSLEPVSAGHAQAKVVLVPKDSRGPRLISMEPLEYQWIQQGLSRKIVEHVEEHYLTRGCVNFTSQTINQNLALMASVDQTFATLDLKDASDRVSLSLVKAIFPDHLYEALKAARSDSTLLPDGRVATLAKFAPMGSCLCFPILALTVWAICVAEDQYEFLTRSRSRRHVYVYGDDLIVANTRADEISNRLEAYGLRVNRDKSYSKGFFRESCGVDAWNGVDVVPYKVKKPLFGQHQDNPETYVSLVNAYNSLFQRGYWRSAKYILGYCESKYGRVPYGTQNSGYPCIVLSDEREATALNLSLPGLRARWHHGYQSLQFRVKTQRSNTRIEDIDGWTRLLKVLVSPSDTDPSVVPAVRTALKNAWRSV